MGSILRSLATEHSRARLGRWLLALAITGSALGLGSLHLPVLCAVAVTAALATGLVWYDAEPVEARPAATALVVVGVALTGWTALQAIPIPRALLASIASENADVWARVLTPLHEEGPRLVTLSLDPVASRVQVLRGVTYLVVFLGALHVARRREGVAFLERVLVVSAVAVAGAALVHPTLGVRKVFGIYEPKETIAYMAGRVGPLLNLNHLAAYSNIGLLVAFAALVERRETLPRPVALVIVLLLGATTVWTLSRGGTATMVLGTFLVVLLVLGSRRSRRHRVAGPIAVASVGIGGTAVLLLSLFDDTATKFAHNELSKVDLVKNAFQLLRSFGVFGVGRGAFESTFPHVRSGTGYWVATHPENVFAQWTTEWGVPIALAAFVAIGWALRPKTALARSRPPAGAWAALAAVAAHNLVDFNAEVPGVVVALSVCAAIVTGGTGGAAPASQREGRWAKHPRLLAVAGGVATALALAVTIPISGHELYDEERAFRDFALDRSVPRDAFHERAREVMLRHPAEAYLSFVGAVRATVVRDESVLPWAARALERSPVYGRVHLLLARSLFLKNPAQARLEYRTACVQDWQICTMDEALPLVGGFDEAMELVPDGPRGSEVLSRLSVVLQHRLPASVVRLDRELSAREPTALGPVQRAASTALGDVRDKEAWCVGDARAACVEGGLAAARRLRTAAPDGCEGHALTAELRIAAGDLDAGFAELDGALDQVAARSECARRLVKLAQQTGNNLRVDAALERLLKLGCEAPAECVTNLTFAAGVEAARGSTRRAFALTKKAWERAPERDDLLTDLAIKAEAQGFHGEALEAYTKLAERHPEEPKWTAAVARERQAATRSVFERKP